MTSRRDRNCAGKSKDQLFLGHWDKPKIIRPILELGARWVTHEQENVRDPRELE